MKPTLFFDFDGLMFNTFPAHVAYMNHRYGINCSVSDFENNAPFEKILSNYGVTVSKEKVYEDFGTHFSTSIKWHADVLPVEGLTTIVPLLVKRYGLWIVTARQKSGKHVIEYLLDKYVPGCASGIHCVWEHQGNGKFVGVPKKDFIQNFQGNKVAFFDDSISEILETQQLIASYHFDPHYKGITNSNIVRRFHSLYEIGELFL